jgi:hypothetical protein
MSGNISFNLEPITQIANEILRKAVDAIEIGNVKANEPNSNYKAKE